MCIRRQACLVDVCLLQKVIDSFFRLHNTMDISSHCRILISTQIYDFFDFVLYFSLFGWIEGIGT